MKKTSTIHELEPGKTPIRIGGKVHNLFFSMRSLAELEKTCGDANEMLDKCEAGDIEAICTFIWAGLLHEKDPGITADSLMDMMSPKEFADNLTSVYAALYACFPVQVAAPDGAEGNAPAGQTE